MNSIKNNPIKIYPLRHMRYQMGTFLAIEIFHSDRAEAKKLLGLAFSEVKRIEGILSRFEKDSLLYKINETAYVEPQIISWELFQLIKKCLVFSEICKGAFDITMASLSDLWSQAEKNGALPAKEEVYSLLSQSGYKNIILDRETMTIYFKSPLLKLDLGAVGKGYALDKAVEILRENKVQKARLDFGGHLYYLEESDAEPEYVRIKNPFYPEGTIVNLPLKNRSIATSANYERSFKVQDRTFGHLINPSTGYQADNSVLSVSIISNCAVYSDILSTAIFILGLEGGMDLIKKLDDTEVEAIIITDNNGKPEVYSSRTMT